MASTVVAAGVISIFSGFFRIFAASLAMSGGIVAEKNSVCFFSGVRAIIFLTSWINPISSMRSASSSTRILIFSIFTIFWSIRSKSLPGVATRISTPRFKFSSCGFWETPPYTTQVFRLVNWP